MRGKKRTIQIKKTAIEEELLKLTKKERDPRIKERLIFILNLYHGDSPQKAGKRVGVAKSTAYAWLKRWNEGGYQGLAPNFKGGAPTKLTEEQFEEIHNQISDDGEWTVNKIREEIKARFGVAYSPSQAWKIARWKFGLKYSKLSSKSLSKNT